MKHLLILLGALLTSPGAAADVALTITSRNPAPAALQNVTGGVPFGQGAVRDISRLRLVADGREVAAQFRTTARWPDGSIRWLRVDTQVPLAAAPQALALTLLTDSAAAPYTGVTVADAAATLTVDTGRKRFAFSKPELAVEGRAFEVVSGSRTYRAVPASWTVEESGPMKAVIRVAGSMLSDGSRLGSERVGFRAWLAFWRDDDAVRVTITFANRGGFNWAGDRARAADVVLTSARFGRDLLGGGEFTFGPGVERTWRLVFSASGPPATLDSRFDADGRVASGYAVPEPLLAASPSAYASSKAWGVVALPIAGGDFDRFEKIQRAKVIAADLENPPNATGRTVWGHLAADHGSWNDYGDLRWDGNGCGTFSGNHYDWSYGMYLQFMRTGRIEFADAARVFASHEIDFDVYHTGDDGPAYNFQKNWEDRPSHDSPDNCFGGGRPTHTWAQGYALHWLMTGDPRGIEAFEELQEGIRQYLYESFVDDGHVDTNEIRTQGWIVDNLIALWRIDPQRALDTPNGKKAIPQVIRDVLQNVFARESAAGGRGFVYASAPGDDENSPNENLRAPLMNAYFVEPGIKAYDEVFRTTDPAYAATLLALIRRMTDYLMSITYGGDSDASGAYRPRQIPYFVDARQPVAAQGQGQLPYLLMASNAAGFLYSETGVAAYRDYARAAFADYVRHVGAIPGDAYGDPALRTPASYNSSVFTGTESKIHGWSSRYGQYYLESERGSRPVSSRRRSVGR